MRLDMIHRAALLTVVVLAVGLAPTASGSAERSAPIRIGVGIGPIKLGMSGQQVRQLLGRPRTVVERRVVLRQPYIELEYGYGAYSVGLLGRKGQRRVVLIATGLVRHKTPEGVGVGTTERAFFRRMRGRGVRERHCSPQTPQTHWLLRRGRTETIFFPQPTVTVGEMREIVSVEVRTYPTTNCAF
jgi:hypothetical protein